MGGPWLSAATMIPLGLYFGVLAAWHGGRRPRVVAGLADYGLLLLGVGGVVAFGPLGQFLVAAIFKEPDLKSWLAFLSILGLLASLFARRAMRRVVVYHVDGSSLDAALTTTLVERVPGLRRTIGGYEQPQTGRWIAVDPSPKLQTTVIEVHGKEAEALAEMIRRQLKSRLEPVVVPPSRSAGVFLALAGFLILASLIRGILAEPGLRTALRAFLGRLWSS
jgi:hypothetical protein